MKGLNSKLFVIFASISLINSFPLFSDGEKSDQYPSFFRQAFDAIRSGFSIEPKSSLESEISGVQADDFCSLFIQYGNDDGYCDCFVYDEEHVATAKACFEDFPLNEPLNITVTFLSVVKRESSKPLIFPNYLHIDEAEQQPDEEFLENVYANFSLDGIALIKLMKSFHFIESPPQKIIDNRKIIPTLKDIKFKVCGEGIYEENDEIKKGSICSDVSLHPPSECDENDQSENSLCVTFLKNVCYENFGGPVYAYEGENFARHRETICVISGRGKLGGEICGKHGHGHGNHNNNNYHCNIVNRPPPHNITNIAGLKPSEIIAGILSNFNRTTSKPTTMTTLPPNATIPSLILNLTSQAGNLNTIRELVLAQTKLPSHNPCYDTLLKEIDIALATINAVLPTMNGMSLASAQLTVDTITVMTKLIQQNLVKCYGTVTTSTTTTSTRAPTTSTTVPVTTTTTVPVTTTTTVPVTTTTTIPVTTTTTTVPPTTTSTVTTTPDPTTTSTTETTTSTTIDPLLAALQTIASQRALLESFIPLITSQTNLTPHDPCYDTSLMNFQTAITAIDALLPLIMTAQDAQDAVTAINVQTMVLLNDLTTCNTMAG